MEKNIALLIVSLLVVGVAMAANDSMAIMDENGPLEQQQLPPEEQVLDLQRRAVPAYTACSVADCTTITDRPTLIQCCNYFSKCCAQANRVIVCPTAAVAPATGTNNCNLFGPFCRTTDDCNDGATKCCPNTNAGSTIPKYKCCWTVA